MCGIVGYVGPKPAQQILISGLNRLEYRGYDSAGIATVNGGMHIRRTVGRVGELERAVAKEPVLGTTGIAHTRWATHGAPSEENAHPHIDASGRIALVHNGIIENHATIRTYLEGQGVEFTSETDTEALVQLIGFRYDQSGDLLDAVRQSLADVSGTFGLALVCADAPDTVIAARRGSPLLVGVGEKEYIVASDGSAIVEHTSQVVYLDDNEMVVVSPRGLEASTIDAVPLEKAGDVLEVELEEIELSGFSHHMAKEIHEQPTALTNTMRGRVDAKNGRITLGGLADLERDLPKFRRLILIGCGTAWHAGLVGEYLFEDLARLPTEVEYASELRYRNPIVDDQTMAVVISQSGETADTLAALREVKMKGARVFGVVNVVGSTIARDTDAGVDLHVGPEIGVASTKAFTAQVLVLSMMALVMGRQRHLSADATERMVQQLAAVPEKVEQVLALDDAIRAIAERYVERDNWLYLGRGVNYPVALEGALKLKEISYIHAEGMPAAEMKHGPIALIDDGMPVVVVAAKDHTYEKVIANIEEVRGRGGRVIAVTNADGNGLREIADEVIAVPGSISLLSPLITTVPLQLLAYHAAVLRGFDVDRPRNLAKSVTVE